MFDSTEGLPGPVTTNRLGKPATVRPRQVLGPCAQTSFSDSPPRPVIGCTARMAPVSASKPVAKTMASRSKLLCAVLTPVAVISRIGSSRRFTSVTLGRVEVA